MTTAPTVVPSALPFDPTRDRVFTPADTLRLQVQAIHDGRAPLTATVSAMHSDGTIALTFDRPLESRRPAALDVRLPLGQLTPGAYRLRVRVADGSRADGATATRSAEREIGFEIR
jgi:hypothetical protein